MWGTVGCCRDCEAGCGGRQKHALFGLARKGGQGSPTASPSFRFHYVFLYFSFQSRLRIGADVTLFTLQHLACSKAVLLPNLSAVIKIKE